MLRLFLLASVISAATVDTSLGNITVPGGHVNPLTHTATSRRSNSAVVLDVDAVPSAATVGLERNAAMQRRHFKSLMRRMLPYSKEMATSITRTPDPPPDLQTSRKILTEAKGTANGGASTNHSAGVSSLQTIGTSTNEAPNLFVVIKIAMIIVGALLFCLIISFVAVHHSQKPSDIRPTREDMVAAKLLYVRLKMDYTKNHDMINLADLRKTLGDGGGSSAYATIGGLRHKYFTYYKERHTCCGIYVWYNQKYLDSYMKSPLFTGAKDLPHVAEVKYSVLDVIPGTQHSIENVAWPNTPPTRQDLCNGKMLVVDMEMDYTTGVQGLPTNADELYVFLESSYIKSQFGDLEGLRGKYWAYDRDIDHCYGFYTFTTEAALDAYMDSDLFKQSWTHGLGGGPHIKKVTYEVQDILEGTERTMDLGTWGCTL